MNRESVLIFTTAIVLSAGIVGGLYYLSLKELRRPSGIDTVQPESQDAAKQVRQKKSSSNGRTAAIKKCTKPDGSEFWTNAVNCDGADLNNRISRADPMKSITGQKYSSATRDSRNSGKSGKAGKPGEAGKPRKSGNSYSSASQKSPLKPIPQTMPVSCKFPIGMARKIERKSLSLKSDPADSIWKKPYCRWVCDARTEGCEYLDDYLEYIELCPPRWRVDQRSCGAT